MTRTYRFVQVDVFTDRPFGGNQLAVFPQATGIGDDEMLLLAQELNYSETTFVLPGSSPQSPRVRIFTPGGELPFAGHPTLGTAWVLLREGVWHDPQEVVLEEGIGPVRVRFEAPLLWMQHRLPEWGPVFDDRAAIARMLRLSEDDLLPDVPVQIASTGGPFLYVPLRTLDVVRRVQFDTTQTSTVFGDTQPVSVMVFTLETEQPGHTVHSRMFAPHTFAIPEDAATGSAAGPLGAYLVRYNLVPRAQTVTIINEQGFEMGRPSLLSITLSMNGDQIEDIWVGGQVVLTAEGTFYVPEA